MPKEHDGISRWMSDLNQERFDNAVNFTYRYAFNLLISLFGVILIGLSSWTLYTVTSLEQRIGLHDYEITQLQTSESTLDKEMRLMEATAATATAAAAAAASHPTSVQVQPQVNVPSDGVQQPNKEEMRAIASLKEQVHDETQVVRELLQLETQRQRQR